MPSCNSLPHTAKLSARVTTEPQTTVGLNPGTWHRPGAHACVADALDVLHRLRLISTEIRASHSEGKPS
ncbi:MAG: hypothetical protein EB107_04240 [Proteobacteria bacterium]|nr:hypothetical protein [Pseudomonadota bacterium]